MRYNRKLFSFNSRKAREGLIKRSRGILLDVYNGCLLDDESDFDAEHILPLKSAWDMGFNNQYREDRAEALRNMKR